MCIIQASIFFTTSDLTRDNINKSGQTVMMACPDYLFEYKIIRG